MSKSVKLKVKYFDESLPKLENIEGAKSDWIDLYARQDVFLRQGDFKLVPLNVAMQLPKGYEAHVVPRSSLFKTTGCIQTNSVGIIDESYCGNEDEWRLPLFCVALRPTSAVRDGVPGMYIEKGQRLCQFRLFKHQPDIVFEEVSYLEGDNRGGFGTTGK